MEKETTEIEKILVGARELAKIKNAKLEVETLGLEYSIKTGIKKRLQDMEHQLMDEIGLKEED